MVRLTMEGWADNPVTPTVLEVPVAVLRADSIWQQETFAAMAVVIGGLLLALIFWRRRRRVSYNGYTLSGQE